MKGIQAKYGDHHRLIITEAGLARMYKHGGVGPGDVGWLWPGETIPEEQYWNSLRWYNENLMKDKLSWAVACSRWRTGVASGRHSVTWATTIRESRSD